MAKPGVQRYDTAMVLARERVARAAPHHHQGRDITTLGLDAIVNAPIVRSWAAEASTGHHRAATGAASPNADLAAAKRARPRSPRASPAARHVIHTVGPIWEGGAGEETCWPRRMPFADARQKSQSALDRVSRNLHRRLCLSPDSPHALRRTVVDKLSGDTHFGKVVFCCFTSASADLHEQAYRALKLKPSPGG